MAGDKTETPTRNKSQTLFHSPSALDTTKLVSSPPVVHNYPSANDYATAVRAWLWAYHSWSLSQCMAPLAIQQSLINSHYHAQQSSAHLAVVSTTASSSSSQVIDAGGLRQRHTAQPVTSVSQPSAGVATGERGSEHYIATYGRRLLAEIIDGLLCFFLKLMLTYALVELGLINLEKYEKLFGPYGDLKTFIEIMHELLPYEIASKLLISVLEAAYITYGCGVVRPGSTPGKHLTGICIIGCSQVHGLGTNDGRVTVLGVEALTMWRAFVRSCMKNFALGFVFPLCMTMYIGRNNRSMYDVACGTVVVERTDR